MQRHHANQIHPRWLTMIVALVVCGCAWTGRRETVARSPHQPVLLNPEQIQSRRHLVEMEERLKDQLLAEPENADAYRQLGEVYYRQGQYFAARRQLTQCAKLAPRDAMARYLLARVARESGDDREALTQVQAALSADPNLADAYALKGRLLLDSGRNAEAISAFEAGWRQRPPSVAAGVELALWDAQRGNDEQAADRLRLCLVHDPRQSVARSYHAEILDRLGRHAESAREYEALVSQGEASAQVYYRLARLYQRLDRIDLAQTSLSHAVRLAPGDREADRLRQQLSHADPAPSRPQEYRPLLSAKP